MLVRLMITTVLLLGFSPIDIWAVPKSMPVKKKFIKHGWDMPDPAFVAGHIREMEKRPFDGIIMKVAGKHRGNIFLGGRWSPADLEADSRAMGNIKWGRFRSNFLLMYAASQQDWFSDEDWVAVLGNVRIMAETARKGACSLAFDPEPYGNSPWSYAAQRHVAGKSYEEYARKVRERGRQFIQEIGHTIPDNVLLTFFTFSIFSAEMEILQPDKRLRALEKHRYGLYLPFLVGILDGLGPKMTLVDGNEKSYYFTKAEQFQASRKLMRETALQLIPPEARAVFLAQTRASQALYPDLIFGEGLWMKKRAGILTPDEQVKWFEHNAYWALKTADEYVWLYSEKEDWWRNPAMPASLPEVILRVSRAIDEDRDLGFDLRRIWQDAEDRRWRR